MVAPCRCIGSNKWVHRSCARNYCIQALLANPEAVVACPICKTEFEYEIDHVQSLTERAGAMLYNVDEAIRNRHIHLALLVIPVVICMVFTISALSINSLADADETLLLPLMVDNRDGWGVIGKQGLLPSRWYGSQAARLAQLYDPDWKFGMTDAQHARAYMRELERATTATDTDPDGYAAPHPAGTSRWWSNTYMWIQHLQCNKLLSWQIALVPVVFTAAFDFVRVFGSARRWKLFRTWQVVPFALAQFRHITLALFGTNRAVQLVFFSIFTSHVEVSAFLACDVMFIFKIGLDWWQMLREDFLGESLLQRLQHGATTVATRGTQH
jgi:hypothetical protein